ncbi:MAG: hypothetical protein J5X22_08540 [Candidatus Accumulibacter sp.]|uniref:Uncharacterized protein n=2 Tax=Candidatus Accumulibacter TaxID=327159 RepID=A0A080M350_9PROT|nr:MULTISPECIES: hypothetical protein [Candidatus Accumulibacter]KFB75707.1 MAG: hypothetical protein AW06_003248 [Candidatus Accumulibacter cognatus]MBL8401820.1 hypothetical protein [Accumulibacter sp.]MBN8517296.1 hypothetical protein [Accumulibacter sp.]MBO3710550.1 hypothetical protein [Accumulibacter sp.]MCC2866747.1 hypothetical protein [Candidatus Accumulibacter phosphatis]
MSSNDPPFSSLRLAVPGSGFFGRLITIAVGALLLVAALMFSLLVLAVLLAVGLLVLACLKWKTRYLRGHSDEPLRNQTQSSQPQPAPGGRVIDGEIIGDAEYETRSSTRHRPTANLPASSNHQPRPAVDP